MWLLRFVIECYSKTLITKYCIQSLQSIQNKLLQMLYWEITLFTSICHTRYLNAWILKKMYSMALTSILNTAYLSAAMSFPEIGSKLNLCFTFKRQMSFWNIFLKKDEGNNLKDKSYTVNSFTTKSGCKSSLQNNLLAQLLHFLCKCCLLIG